MLDPALLEILVCPKCHAKVEPRDVTVGDRTETRLVCTGPACGLRYPIHDGIPVMLIEEADAPPSGR
ncbi:MAG: Trm112 family protein [Phycisphaerae bacterium]